MLHWAHLRLHPMYDTPLEACNTGSYRSFQLEKIIPHEHHEYHEFSALARRSAFAIC